MMNRVKWQCLLNTPWTTTDSRRGSKPARERLNSLTKTMGAAGFSPYRSVSSRSTFICYLPFAICHARYEPATD